MLSKFSHISKNFREKVEGFINFKFETWKLEVKKINLI